MTGPSAVELVLVVLALGSGLGMLLAGKDRSALLRRRYDLPESLGVAMQWVLLPAGATLAAAAILYVLLAVASRP